MNLYKEEQVRDLLRQVWTYTPTQIDNLIDIMEPIELPSDSLCINCDESESTHNICMDCIIKIGKENIQLPSDEDIYAMGKDVIIYNDTKRGWFIEGLKFMRDKIQGGKDE